MDKQEGARARISRFRQFLWHFNRLPSGKMLKTALRIWHWQDVAHRRRLARRLPADDQLEALAAAFNRDGYARIESIIDPAVLAPMSTAAEGKLKRAQTAPVDQLESHKAFWLRLLDEDMRDGALPVENPFVRFALQPSVINLLSRILGEVPRLDSALLTYSRHTNAPLSYSQLWHRDHDDTRTIKMFVYLTDVQNLDDGPFSFLPGPVSDRFSKWTRRSHKADAVVFGTASPEDKVQIVAPRFSAFIVETSRCMHMGSRMAPGHHRLLYTASYFSAPRMYPSGKPRILSDDVTDEVTRLVLRA